MTRIRFYFTAITIFAPLVFGFHTAAAVIAGLHALQMLIVRNWNLETGLPPIEFEWLSHRLWRRYGLSNYDGTMKAFLTEVNAIDPGTTPDKTLSTRAIPRKLGYEYQRKYGTLMYGYMTFFTLSFREALRPLTLDERERFYQFCREHDM